MCQVEIRKVDSVVYDGSWVWNDSMQIGTAQFGEDWKADFLAYLQEQGFAGMVKAVQDGELEMVEDDDCIELVDAKTGEILMAARLA